MNYRLGVLRGDGIGPEIVAATLQVLEAAQERDARLRFEWVPLPMGWEAIRATGNAKAEAYRAGVAAIGPQQYTAMQLMQIVGDRNVRIVPEVSVTGRDGGGMVDGLLGLLLKKQAEEPAATEKPAAGA